MIISELKGGLGNQLFQYAAGLALAKFHKTNLKVNIENLKSPDEILDINRKYMLNHLASPPSIATIDEIKRFSEDKISRLFSNYMPLKSRINFSEKHFHFNNKFWSTNFNVQLKGNFQSPLYFKNFEKEIIEKIEFNPSIFQKEVKDYINSIRNINTIGLHVRRGDYVSNQVANDWLGTLPLKYYKSAYEYISNKISVDSILVFSDDLIWAKENLTFMPNTRFINFENLYNDLIDFYLMSQCQHNIIANSSFSWWAAYLNPNPNKIVIAPKNWFNKAPLNTKDLYPQEWIII